MWFRLLWPGSRPAQRETNSGDGLFCSQRDARGAWKTRGCQRRMQDRDHHKVSHTQNLRTRMVCAEPFLVGEYPSLTFVCPGFHCGSGKMFLCHSEALQSSNGTLPSNVTWGGPWRRGRQDLIHEPALLEEVHDPRVLLRTPFLLPGRIKTASGGSKQSRLSMMQFPNNGGFFRLPSKKNTSKWVPQKKKRRSH